MRRASSSTVPTPSLSKRPRNANATREAILRSALIAFSQSGYDGVGVREIAGEAGVTAMLVNRYFGSKEKLFAAAVETIFSEGELLNGDIATLSRHAAGFLVGGTASDASPTGELRADPLLLMLRSAASPQAAAILRDGLERHFQQPLAASLPGIDVRERAVLFLGLVAGFQLMYRVIGAKPLVEADPELLAKRLESMFQLLVSPPQRRSEAPAPKSETFGADRLAEHGPIKAAADL
ncbi:MAG TPA: TetR family transcriptional regulator [Aliidongia sp.]|nr:TetR family transcriptional regulator [Aliidongia sp.]